MIYFILLFLLFFLARNQWTFGVSVAYNHGVYLQRTVDLDMVKACFTPGLEGEDLTKALRLSEKLLKRHAEGPSYEDLSRAFVGYSGLMLQFWEFNVDKFVVNRELYSQVEPFFMQSLKERSPWTLGLETSW